MFEALSRLYWQSFKDWLDNSTDFNLQNPGMFDQLEENINCLVSHFEVVDNVLKVEIEPVKEILMVSLAKTFLENVN